MEEMSNKTTSSFNDDRLIENTKPIVSQLSSLGNRNNDSQHEELEEDECWDDAEQEQISEPININKMRTPSDGTNNHQILDRGLLEANQAEPSKHPSPVADESCSIEQQQKHSTTDRVVDLTLHEAVFNNDANRIYEILKNKNSAKEFVNGKDKHGNTPLHLACMLGRSKEIVSALLQCGASVDCKNLNRWTPFHEACSYGNREIISLMTKRLNDDVCDALKKHKLQENLEKTKNYRLVLKWEFQSWVPLITRVLPSDVCVINKQGKFIRIDTGLLDFEMFSQKKAHSCLIYADKFEKKWMVVNHEAKQYQHFETQTSKDIETKVDEFMSIDIMDFEMKSADIQLTRSTSGWIWKADKMDKVGRYNAALYNFNNVFLITRKRREHLKEEDLKRNKLAYKGAMHVLKFGKKPSMKDLEEANQGYDSNDDNNDENWEDAEDSENPHRESLSPPPASNVTWAQYCQAEAGQFPTLGREHKCKVVKTAFKAKIAMTDEFPITKNEFLDLLSIVPLKMFKKLKEFIEMKLPEGFPVRLDIPIFPFLTARITFEDFSFINGPIDESLFSIPSDYEENPNLVPILNGKLKGPSASNNNG